MASSLMAKQPRDVQDVHPITEEIEVQPTGEQKAHGRKGLHQAVASDCACRSKHAGS